jgi:hypothetical protein
MGVASHDKALTPPNPNSSPNTDPHQRTARVGARQRGVLLVRVRVTPDPDPNPLTLTLPLSLTQTKPKLNLN